MQRATHIRVYNTLTRRKEDFSPVEPGRVRIYTCGPTVYRYAHIGNLRSYLMADWLRRLLEAQGYRVKHVKNITDVGHMRQDMVEREMFAARHRAAILAGVAVAEKDAAARTRDLSLIHI